MIRSNSNCSANSIFGLLALLLSLICLNTAPLALGAVHPQSSAIFVGLSILALIFHLADQTAAWSRKNPQPDPGHPKKSANTKSQLWYGLPFFLSFIFTLMMLVPLSDYWRTILSPEGTGLVKLLTADLSPSARKFILPVLSLDPPETAFRLLQMIAACCFFIVIANHARSRKSRQLIFRALFIGGLGLYTVSVVHTVLDLPIWGIYGEKNTPLFAPLVNPNNLARVFGLYAFFCAAGALQAVYKIESYLFSLVAILCASGVFLTLSRGGILAFVFTIVLAVAWLSWIEPKTRKNALNHRLHKHVGLAFLALMILASAAALNIAGRQIQHEIESLQGQLEHADKAELYKPGLMLIRDHWQVGIAPNALYSAFFTPLSPLPHTPFLLSGKVNIPFVENTFLQTFIDHGLIKGGILIMLCIAILLGIIRKTAANKVTVLLLCALIFVFVGDIMDFAIEIGAILWLVALALALVAGMQASVSAPGTKYRYVPSLLLVNLVFISCFGYFAFYSISANTDDAYKNIENTGLEDKESYIENHLAQHPLNSELIFKLVAVQNEQKKFTSSEHWAQMSILVRPTDVRGHLLLAQAQIMQIKYADALLSLKRAWTTDPNQGSTILKVIDLLVPNPNELFSYLPANHSDFILTLCEFFQQKNLSGEFNKCIARLAISAGLTDSQIREAISSAIDLKLEKTALTLRTNLREKHTSLDAVQLANIELLTEKFDAKFLQKKEHLLVRLREPCEMISWLLSKTRQHNLLTDAWRMLKMAQSHACFSAINVLDHALALHEQGGHPGLALNELEKLIGIDGPSCDRLLHKIRLQLATNQILQAEATVQAAARLDNNDQVKAMAEEIKQKKLELLGQLVLSK